MNNKKLIIGITTGAILGIFCIIGVSVRLGYKTDELFILATWVNRVVIGLVVGLASCCATKSNIFRGALLGLIISGSFFLATAFKDVPGFIAGIIYGVIIDRIVMKSHKEKDCSN